MTRTTRARRRAESARPQEVDDEQFDDQEDFEDEDEGEDEPRGSRDKGGGVFSQLKDEVSGAALAVLAPVAKEAATKAAKFAVKKGPQLMEETVLPAIEDAGGPKEMLGSLVSGDGPAGGLVSKLTGGGEGKSNAGDGTGKGRRMPVQQAVDVAAPIDIVYDQFTQFEDYPKFMHRLESVEQREDETVAFHAKMWGFKRSWEAEIVEQRPDERIVFKSNSGLMLTGVVTFHDLAERLTRIELNIDVAPSGPVEKIARGTRFIKRAARADLKRFKAFVEMREDETGAWRGEIQDGEVVSESDEDQYDDYDDEYEDEDQYDEDSNEPVAEEEDSEGDEDEEEPGVEDDDEREEAPRRARSRSRSSSSSGGSRRQSSSKSKSQSSGSKKRSSSSSAKSRSGSSRSRGSSNGGDPKSSKSGNSRSGNSRSRGGSSKSKSSSRSKSTSGKRSS
jgi:uncharacterized membrane protein